MDARGEYAAEIEIRRLQAERDALAAHVERMREFLRSAPLESGVCCCGDNISNHPSPMSCGHSPVDSGEYAISQILDDDPTTTSLARLKAEWQVQALEQLLDDWVACRHDHLPWMEFIGRRIDELKRQVEETSDE